MLREALRPALGGLRSSSSRRASSSYTPPRPSGSRRAALGWAVASGAAVILYVSARPLRLDVDVEKEQREDPDGVVSGAKGSLKTGQRSHVDVAENLRGEGWKVDPDKGEGKGYLTLQQVEMHNLAQDAWVVVDGKVFDVTDFHKRHPGGSSIIVANAGKDVTELFKSIHPPNTIENNLPPESLIGLIDPEEARAATTAWKAEQDRIAAARAALPEVETILGLDEMEDAAKSFLPRRAYDYYAAASLDGISLHHNRSAFHKCRFVPRIMRNVLVVKPQARIFGVDSALPIYVSPSSNAMLGHPDGELNITRGAAKTGVVQGISAAASFPLTEILEEKDKLNGELGRKMGMVYQVYIQDDRSKTEAQVKEAVAGGVQALILTCDSNVGDLRQSVEKVKGTKGDCSPGVRMEPHVAEPWYHDPKQNWGDLAWIKSMSGGLPIYLKGVSHIDDVRLAVKHGLAGCILSNHGGRQMDQARTGFDALRSIHAEDPQLLKDTEVYIDGGVRRGTDVLMALAYGAKGVGLGRPFLYAQAAYGEKGVIRNVRILEREIVTAMRLLGVTSLEEVNPSMVECLQELWK